jgi:hypothetical protein
MLQTISNIKNDILNIISNKDEKIQYIKEYYIPEDSFEIQIPKYILIDLLNDYEDVLISILNVINKPTNDEININTINSNILYESKDNSDKNMIIELAKELNLQFDYSQYANIFNNKEEVNKTEAYNFNDLDKDSAVIEEPQPVAIKQGLRQKIKSALKSNEFNSTVY